MKGLVAFSFGLCKQEPNPCNVRIAQEVERIVREEGEPVAVVAQWEVARALKTRPECTVILHAKGEYLDSEEVMRQAAEFFQRRGIQTVIPVAQPFLQLWKCQGLVERAGFSIARRTVQRIGFCTASEQWWTRGPIRLLLYAVLQCLFRWRGK